MHSTPTVDAAADLGSDMATPRYEQLTFARRADQRRQTVVLSPANAIMTESSALGHISNFAGPAALTCEYAAASPSSWLCC